jgi:hypothetical protein
MDESTEPDGIDVDAGVTSSRRERWRGDATCALYVILAAVVAFGPGIALALAKADADTWGEPAAAWGMLLAVGLPVLVMMRADVFGPTVLVRESGDLANPTGHRYLTGWTITGWRSVDLDSITSIRDRRASRNPNSRWSTLAVIVDAHGGRLAVSTWDEVALTVVGAALEDAANRAEPIRLSPLVAFGFDLEPDHYVRRRPHSAALVPAVWWLLLLVSYMATVGSLGGLPGSA